MKTHYYLLLALLVTLSCSQEKEFSTVAAGSPGKITAVLPSVEFDELTKGSSMGQNGFTLTWDEGDYVNVFSEEGTLCLYRVDGANGLSAVAGFDGGGFELKEGHTYYSIFPAVYTPNMDISSIPVDFSDNYQEANGDASHMKEHAYCISSATCVGGNMQFNYQYPVAFLQLVIEIRGGSGGGLKKVTLSADENLFTKSGSMNLVNGMLTGAEMTNTIEINVNDIAPGIYPDINGERPCYVVNTVIAPFEKSTIKCSITLVDGTEIDFYGDTFGLKAGHAKRLNYTFLNKTPSIAGLRFAAGDLCTTENGFAIANSWQETLLAYGNSVTEAGSASPGRFYFNWVELGDVFSTVSVGTGNTNAIDNTMTVNGFRMPTKSEMKAVIDGPRVGSTVNGHAGARWCYAVVNGVTGGLNGNDRQSGMILFPDGEIIVNAGITNDTFNDSQASNAQWYNESMTLVQLNLLLENGCAFLPATRYYEDGRSWFYDPDWGKGSYWTSTCSDSSNNYANYIAFDYDDCSTSIIRTKADNYLPVRLVKADEEEPNPGGEQETPTFAGLEFAPGDLYTTDSGYAIADSWERTIPAYNNSVIAQGSTVAGRFYFNWWELGDLFSQQAVTVESNNNIDNAVSLNGYRLPTKEEWEEVINGSRPGSTVNGHQGVRWCYVLINGVTFDMHFSNAPFSAQQHNGMLIFPDGKNYSSQGITDEVFNSCTGCTAAWYNTTMTLAQLNALLASGCVFLPATGYGHTTSSGDWNFIRSQCGYYWSATSKSGLNAYDLYFYYDKCISTNYESKTDGYLPVRLVRPVNGNN